MLYVLPIAALVLALAAVFLAPPRKAAVAETGVVGEPHPAGLGFSTLGVRIMLACLIVAAVVAGRIWGNGQIGLTEAGLGLALGMLLAVLAHAVEARQSLLGVAPLALAVAVAGSLHLVPQEAVLHGQLAAVFGAALGAWALGVSDRTTRGDAVAAALFLAVVVACDALAREAMTHQAGWRSGTAFGLAAAAVGLITALAMPRVKARRELVVAGLSLVLLVAAGWVVGSYFVHLQDAVLLFAGALVAALIVHLLLPIEERPDALRFVLAVIVWIGLATWAFGLRRGYGMSVSLVGASALLLLLGNPRALLSTGPLVALVYYRIFRESHTDATRALDIGQHYAMIGIAVGAMLPLLPLEWARERRSSIAAGLWIALIAALPVFAAIILGPKGAIGMLAGLGLAAVVEGLRGERALNALTLAAGVAGLTALTYGWTTNLLEMTRDQKIQALLWMTPVTVVVAGAIALLSRPVVEQGRRS
jgi:hypothetical protein